MHSLAPYARTGVHQVQVYAPTNTELLDQRLFLLPSSLQKIQYLRGPCLGSFQVDIVPRLFGNP